MKIFLDTNIIIDFLDDKRPQHNLAKSLFEIMVSNNYEIVISEDILTTVFYICQGKVDHKMIFDFFYFLNKEFLIVGFGQDNISESIDLCQKGRKLDFEDVLQANCAKSNHCNIIITNDKKFPNVGVKIQTTKEFYQKNLLKKE